MATLTQYSTQMGFIAARAPSDKPPFYRSAAGEGFEVSNFSQEQHTVSVSDARPVFDSFNLDTHGFAFAVDPEGTRPEILDAIRAGDKETVRLLYYPIVEELVKRQTQASRVVIFDHTVRRREAALAGKNPNGREQPASTVHCDQSPLGARRRIYQHLPDEADQLLKGRAQIINVWRPLKGPVQDWPLAMMDCTTLAKASIHPTQLYRNRFELRGETVSISHRKDQRWYYLDRQKTDEITFIKIWDSKEGVSGYMCAHCAFQHPNTPEDAPLRESVEVRCLVFYDDEA
ncbi:hypothetical protein Asppvi_007109 [Aspergillus pseudoviridinutans]|uniref:Methyltransferase n=1 Tax=Aspergillus pseudoviridinutans TaxID=1517512 RepID=A0A9P3BI72_9EURO|nr:uncharacterized protein Asppvi_007109 [Aspergillus pseudoviridinutans]GIJ88191.1 hypothetical protein Asppvi_007109 [Aspergillus pseudoviridinutans]